MTKVTIKQVLEVIQTSDTPRGPTVADIGALVNENIRRQTVRGALQRAIREGLLVRSGTKYRLASRPKSLKIRSRHSTHRTKLKNIVTPSRLSKNVCAARRLSNFSSSSEGTGSSRLPSVRDSIELNRLWCFNKCSNELENTRSKAPSKRCLLPVGANEGPSSINNQDTNTGPLECDINIVSPSVQPNAVENSKKFNCWSYLRFW